MTRRCEHCGNEFTPTANQIRRGVGLFCSIGCGGRAHGARRTKYTGAGGGQKSDHVRIAEAALGRPLPDGAQIHHVNSDGRDNRPRNLVICENAAYHKLLHVRTRVLAAGGNPNTDKFCGACRSCKPLGEFYRRSAQGRFRSTEYSGHCKVCARARSLAYQRQKRQVPA